MDDAQRELRATSDALLQDLEVLITLEEEKRTLPADDDRLPELAARIDEIADRLTERTGRQRSLASDVNDAAAVASGPAVAIDETPPRPIAAILAEWREIERRSQDAEPGSPAALEAGARVDALRAEYQRAYVAVREANETRDRPT